MGRNNEDMWSGKALLLYSVVDSDDTKDMLEKGISYSDGYLGILTKERLSSLLEHINSNQSIVVVSVADEVYRYVYDISNDEDYNNWKSQFDYIHGDMLDEIADVFLLPRQYGDSIHYFLPSPLLYGFINKDLEIYKNPNYYDSLSDEDKLYYCEIIKKGINQEIDYKEYVALSNKIQGHGTVKKHKTLTDC